MRVWMEEGGESLNTHPAVPFCVPKKPVGTGRAGVPPRPLCMSAAADAALRAARQRAVGARLSTPATGGRWCPLPYRAIPACVGARRV